MAKMCVPFWYGVWAVAGDARRIGRVGYFKRKVWCSDGKQQQIWVITTCIVGLIAGVPLCRMWFWTIVMGGCKGELV